MSDKKTKDDTELDNEQTSDADESSVITSLRIPKDMVIDPYRVEAYKPKKEHPLRIAELVMALILWLTILGGVVFFAAAIPSGSNFWTRITGAMGSYVWNTSKLAVSSYFFAAGAGLGLVLTVLMAVRNRSIPWIAVIPFILSCVGYFMAA